MLARAVRRAAGLATLLVVAACVGERPPPGPVVSPTGIVYDPGTPPSETRQSQTAGVYIRSGDYQRALDLAKEGIEEHPDNPIHYFLGGMASARLGQYEEADELFREAERIYPAYELDIEPEREAAWTERFNEGLEAYGEGEVEEAIAHWQQAILIYDLRPEAHRNLAAILVGEGRYDEAIDVYQSQMEGLEKEPATRVLSDEEVELREERRIQTEERLAQLLLHRSRFEEAEPLLRRALERDSTDVDRRSDLATALAGQGRDEEASEIYASLLSEEGLEATQLFNLGIALFRTSDFPGAAEAFRRLAEVRPTSRDAWFNYANALFASEQWEELLPVSERLVELDPLNENSAIIAARTRLEVGDEEGAMTALERIDEAPVQVDGLRMESTGNESVLHGQVTGNAADPGTPIRLRFIFYGGDEPLGTETITVSAPAPDDTDLFEISFQPRAETYRYELVR